MVQRTYGDIGKPVTDEMIKAQMNQYERNVYESIQKGDNQRLHGDDFKDTLETKQPGKLNISGIGEVKQIC